MMAQMVRLTTIFLVSAVLLSCVVKSPRRGMETSRQLKIQDIRIAEGSDKTIVEIEGEGLMLFTSFHLSDPERLVLEISDVDLGKYRDKIKLAEGPVRSIMPIPRGDILVSRLEFEVVNEVKTVVRPEGLNIVVEVTQLDGGKPALAEAAKKKAQTDRFTFFSDQASVDKGSKSASEPMTGKPGEGAVDLPLPDLGPPPLGALPPPPLLPPTGIEGPGAMPSPDASASETKKAEPPSPQDVAALPKKEAAVVLPPPETPAVKPLPPATLIKGVRFLEGKELRMVITLNGISNPKIFYSDSRKKIIVIDLPGIKSSAEQKRIPGDGILVHRVRAGKHPDKYRLAVDLIEPAEFSWERTRNELSVTLKKPHSP
ncbi:MAG: AMIN domain-containing protein [Nitrospiria bacterium]